MIYDYLCRAKGMRWLVLQYDDVGDVACGET